MKLKLETRITLIYAMVFTLILTAVNAAVFISVKFYSTGSDNLDLRRTSIIVQDIITKKGTITNDDLTEKGIRFPIVVNVKGPDITFPSMEGLKIVRSGKEGDSLEFTLYGQRVSQEAVVTSYEFIAPDSKSYLITIGKSLEESIYSRRIMIITTAVASLIGMILSLAVGSYISRESFRPINSMRKSVESISAENLSERIVVPEAEDELRELGNTFNSLLDRLETAYMRQSKFVSDASHELRTPLTVIKGFTDMLARWGCSDPEILEEAITAIREETANMSNLVENLLLIAKGESRRLSVNFEQDDLMDIVREVTDETQMNNPGRVITCEGEELYASIDRKMIKQLIRIFTENSIKFTQEGGQIKISLKKEKDKAVIRVWDNGEGISPKDITRIFERFYVADKARTKDKSGSGLGLSIAKWIVDVHSGKLSVESKIGAFSEFIVELPIDQDPERINEYKMTADNNSDSFRKI